MRCRPPGWSQLIEPRSTQGTSRDGQQWTSQKDVIDDNEWNHWPVRDGFLMIPNDERAEPQLNLILPCHGRIKRSRGRQIGSQWIHRQKSLISQWPKINMRHLNIIPRSIFMNYGTQGSSGAAEGHSSLLRKLSIICLLNNWFYGCFGLLWNWLYEASGKDKGGTFAWFDWSSLLVHTGTHSLHVYLKFLWPFLETRNNPLDVATIPRLVISLSQ